MFAANPLQLDDPLETLQTLTSEELGCANAFVHAGAEAAGASATLLFEPVGAIAHEPSVLREKSTQTEFFHASNSATGAVYNGARGSPRTVRIDNRATAIVTMMDFIITVGRRSQTRVISLEVRSSETRVKLSNAVLRS